MNLPFDTDAEQFVVGACLLGAEPPEISPADFWASDARAAFEAILALDAAREPVDAITVSNRSKVDRLTLNDWRTNTTSSGSATHYARIVADMALRRRVIQACQTISAAAIEGDPELRDKAEHAIFAAVAQDRRADTVSLSAVLEEVMDNLERTEQGVAATGVATGLPKIDQMLGGMPRGSMVVLGARPGVGKSALCGNIAVNVARTGLSVLFVSVEMSRWELGTRMLGAEAAVSWHMVRHKGPGMEDWAKLMQANANLDALPIAVMDAATTTVADIRSWARRNKPDLIIVDYLQLLATHVKGENRNLELADLSRNLKLLAREVDAPVLVCSQLNREGDRDNRQPVLRDLRDSGAIEADADMVWFLHVEREEQDKDPRVIDFLVRKNRNGPTGPLVLMFHASTTSFEGR